MDIQKNIDKKRRELYIESLIIFFEKWQLNKKYRKIV